MHVDTEEPRETVNLPYRLKLIFLPKQGVFHDSRNSSDKITALVI
jgi:hypothetical protein